MKKLLTLLLPLSLLSISTTTTAEPTTTSSIDYMVELVGKAREANCQVPFTQAERERLLTDPMVVIGRSYKQWVGPNEFPAFLNVINATMNCDSEKWVRDMKHQLASSPDFKAHLEQIKKSAK
ncbi:hypothetical protein ACPV3S_12905 [Photobacterium damselae]|uniref:hypothetical protein n=1 Tax=Photobacterium damselae TaxID=38293 RepID=UPI0040695783